MASMYSNTEQHCLKTENATFLEEFTNTDLLSLLNSSLPYKNFNLHDHIYIPSNDWQNGEKTEHLTKHTAKW